MIFNSYATATAVFVFGIDNSKLVKILPFVMIRVPFGMAKSNNTI